MYFSFLIIYYLSRIFTKILFYLYVEEVLGTFHIWYELISLLVVTYFLIKFYVVFKQKYLIKKIKKNKLSILNQAKKNINNQKVGSYFPLYPALDPEGDITGLVKSKLVNLCSCKFNNLIYKRILCCIDDHHTLMYSAFDDKTSSTSMFKSDYLNNVKMYFFLIDLIQMTTKDRIYTFNEIKEIDSSLYENCQFYLKNYTQLKNRNIMGY